MLLILCMNECAVFAQTIIRNYLKPNYRSLYPLYTQTLKLIEDSKGKCVRKYEGKDSSYAF